MIGKKNSSSLLAKESRYVTRPISETIGLPRICQFGNFLHRKVKSFHFWQFLKAIAVPKVNIFGNFWQPKVTKIGNFSVTIEQSQNGAQKFPN